MPVITALLSSEHGTLADVIARVLPVNTIVGLEIHGDGGGDWTIFCSYDGAQVVSRRERCVDARLICSVADLISLLRGELDARRAFNRGRLRVQGDVGLFLALEGALSGRLGPTQTETAA